MNRKHIVKNLNEKNEIIKMIEKGIPYSIICKKYNIGKHVS